MEYKMLASIQFCQNDNDMFKSNIMSSWRHREIFSVCKCFLHLLLPQSFKCYFIRNRPKILKFHLTFFLLTKYFFITLLFKCYFIRVYKKKATFVKFRNNTLKFFLTRFSKMNCVLRKHKLHFYGFIKHS